VWRNWCDGRLSMTSCVIQRQGCGLSTGQDHEGHTNGLASCFGLVCSCVLLVAHCSSWLCHQFIGCSCRKRCWQRPAPPLVMSICHCVGRVLFMHCTCIMVHYCNLRLLAADEHGCGWQSSVRTSSATILLIISHSLLRGGGHLEGLHPSDGLKGGRGTGMRVW